MHSNFHSYPNFEGVSDIQVLNRAKRNILVILAIRYHHLFVALKLVG